MMTMAGISKNFACAERNCSERIEEKIEERDDEDATALNLAAANGHVDVVKLLLKANANIETVAYQYRQTPLSSAAVNGHVDVVKLLLNANANIEALDNYGR